MAHPKTIGELADSKQGKNPEQYVYFWGHRQNSNNKVDHSCFSQWFARGLMKDGITYKTAEHFMMAEKARLFNDKNIEKFIIESKNPGEAKSLGRKVSGFDQGIWESKCVEIVLEGNLLKFSQNDDIKNYLIGTGNRVLVEASPVDAIWGIGLDRVQALKTPVREWPGLNMLGFALMEVRQNLLHG